METHAGRQGIFEEVFQQSAVPSDVIAILGKAFSQREKFQQAQECIIREMDKPIIFDDFLKMIKRARSKSAGGITGLSYGMLKLAPDTLLNFLFDLSTNLWIEKHIPEYWKVKYMRLLVKDLAKSGLNNLRPIGLIEVLRKIWGNLIIHRIRCALQDSGFFAETQYGFLYRRGTTDELIQLTNILEEAGESFSHVEITTWDITKAFDSVERTIQLVTWLRMGVPEDIAMWFVRLDNGGGVHSALVMGAPSYGVIKQDGGPMCYRYIGYRLGVQSGTRFHAR